MTMSTNWPIETDAQGRSLPAVVPVPGRRSFQT